MKWFHMVVAFENVIIKILVHNYDNITNQDNSYSSVFEIGGMTKRST